MRRPRHIEEGLEQLRQEPAFKELVRLLRAQGEDQIDRLSERLECEERQESDHGEEEDRDQEDGSC
ncbi:MAG: hypothetical protein AB1646_21205 [Thermodesulfobacteriota bacterium]